MKIYFKKMRAGAKLPSFGNGDHSNAGIDLYCCDDITIEPHSRAYVPSGVAWDPVELLTDFSKPCMIIKPRSSNIKRGLQTIEGTVDCGYRGEIVLCLINLLDQPITIKDGERVAQGVVVLLPMVEVEEKENLSESVRGSNGFGSTGK